MRFLYKIYSRYDGFRPAVLEERMEDRQLRLGWQRYIDVVEKGWECWIYFHGPHKFENGVYAHGIVVGIDLEAEEVTVRVRKYRTDRPITRRKTSRRIAEVVAQRFRQVFVWPEEWKAAPKCSLKACENRQCGDCEIWAELPLIETGHARPPRRLRWSTYEDVISAHWIVPRRRYEAQIVPGVRELTRRFNDFKLGEMAYAHPFARAMFEQLRRRDLLDFDYVVPIPLSPDKARKGESHRTRELARELGKLLAVPKREMLQLTRSVSKRRMKSVGYTTPQFERKYLHSLEAIVPGDANKVLLVDDVVTRGSTVAQAIEAIRKQRRKTTVVVATAGQMIVMESVADESGFKA